MTRALGTFGSIVALGKIGYDIWDKERERKKKGEDNRERLRIIPTYHCHDSRISAVGVQLYNEGKVPIAIRSVTLSIQTAETKNLFPLVMITGLDQHQTEEYAGTKKLEPHEYADFFVFYGQSPPTRELVALPPESLWVTIETFSGESWRVSGEEIKNAIYRDSEYNWSDDSTPSLP